MPKPIDNTRSTYALTDLQCEKIQAEFRFQPIAAEEGFADFIANTAKIPMSTDEIQLAKKRRIEEGQPLDLPIRGNMFRRWKHWCR